MMHSSWLGSVLPALGWAVVHFVWQGALIGVVTWAVLRSMRRSSASARYAVACSALAMCLLAFVATVWIGLLEPDLPIDLSELSHASASVLSSEGRVESSLGSRVPASLIAGLWCAGVLLLAARVAVQWVGARRLRTRLVRSPGCGWERAFESLRVELGIRRGVRLFQSGLAEVPMVVGWFSPVVLVPASAFTSLSPDQLRAVLAHELTHIRRHDHWVNAAQALIETLLFFHPVVWWLSGSARLERENCCDDVAVRSIGHPRILAEALAHLESLRQTKPTVALAANGGYLMNRITRILGTRPSHPAPHTTWRTVTALSAGVMLAAAGVAHASLVRDQPKDPVVKQVLIEAVQAGLSAEQARTIYDTMIFPGSAVEQKMQAAMADAVAKRDAALQSGKLTVETADKWLEGEQRRLAAAADRAFETEILGHTDTQDKLVKLREKLADAVERGQLSPEDAEAKYQDAEKAIRTAEAKVEALKAKASELKTKVAAGELTQEEADTQMRTAKAEAADGRGQRATTESSWNALRKRVEGAVQSGEMTREDADEMYQAFKQKAAKAVPGSKAKPGAKKKHDIKTKTKAKAKAKAKTKTKSGHKPAKTAPSGQG